MMKIDPVEFNKVCKMVGESCEKRSKEQAEERRGMENKESLLMLASAISFIILVFIYGQI